MVLRTRREQVKGFEQMDPLLCVMFTLRFRVNVDRVYDAVK